MGSRVQDPRRKIVQGRTWTKDMNTHSLPLNNSPLEEKYHGKLSMELGTFDQMASTVPRSQVAELLTFFLIFFNFPL